MMNVVEAVEAAASASIGVGLILLLWLVWVSIGARRRARRIGVRIDALSHDQNQATRQSSPNPAITRAGLCEHWWTATAARLLSGSEMTYPGQRFSRSQLAAIAVLPAAGTCVALLRVFGSGLPAGIVASIAVWFIAFRMLVGVERRRSERLLIASFPEAIDMIVRMIRAGMAVSGAIRAASSDLPQPLGAVFRAIAEEFAIGVPLDQVMGAMARRIRLPEFRFFAVAVSLQHATGGSLTTTLENMADMMRRRRTMQLKAKALVSEVRMTAAVLSFLPVVALLLLLFSSPDYISALFFDHRGNILLSAAALCVLTGAASMRWMMHRNLRL